MTCDLSLLRLREPGPYPFVPLEPITQVRLGDWVLKLGHPIGYRRDRPPVVRLGRVLCQEGDLFVTDCNVTGGDSGGPLIDLDGRLVGMVGASEFPATLNAAPVPRPQQLFNCQSASVIQRFLPSMLRPAISKADWKEHVETVQRLVKTKNMLPFADFTQGTAVGSAFGEIAKAATSEVVEIRNENSQQVALGTIVDSDGWILTVASLMPAKPSCRLPDGTVMPAKVVRAKAAFDLAILKVSASHLRPVAWAEHGAATTAGAILAAPSASPTEARSLLCMGIVSVATRVRPGPFLKRSEHPKVAASSTALGMHPLVWSKPYADFPEFFEHDMPLLPSQCGGPVIDLDGRAVGITVFRGEYGCMAIPANCIERLLPELRTGKVPASGDGPHLAPSSSKRP